jgi:hypothetical protein
MSKNVLKEWESDDFMLDNSFMIRDKLFKYIDEVKIYMIENKKNHKFLNRLNDKDKISDTDYDYLMRWYYDRKTYKEPTPEEIEASRILHEKRDKESKEKYQKLLDLIKKNNIN